MTSSARTDHGKSKTRSSMDRMTGFSGLTGGAGRLLGIKTFFFCNLKLINLRLKTFSIHRLHRFTQTRRID
jgi:hypothetical protein